MLKLELLSDRGGAFVDRVLLGFCAGLLICALTIAEASAEKRVALVIGNSAYQNVEYLRNPSNDAGAVAKMLQAAKFDVVEARLDLPFSQMRRVLRDFSTVAFDADMAVVFYAGHALEMDGTNYLLPVDALLERDIDVKDEGIEVDRILQILDPVRQLRLVILDACRNNPFSKNMKRTMTVASRSIGQGGLKEFAPTSSNTLIAFAARAGATAADGTGTNSPFTTALLKNLPTPGLDLRLAFGKVRDDVFKATRGKQEPHIYGSLGGNVVPLVSAPAKPVEVDPRSEIRRDYEIAERAGTKEAWDSFLIMNPTGFYADAARAHRSKLGQGNVTPADSGAKGNLPMATAATTAATTRRQAEGNAAGSVTLQATPSGPPSGSPAAVAPSSPPTGPLVPETRQQQASLTPVPNIPLGPPSFDCLKDRRPDEQTICKSPKLSYLDREMDVAYTALRRRLSGSQRDALKDEQTAWWKKRTACLSDEVCLTAVYEARLEQLKSRR